MKNGELVRNMMIDIQFNSILYSLFIVYQIMLFSTTVHLTTGWLMLVKVLILSESALDMMRLK